MRGRKPKANAIRRMDRPVSLQAQTVDEAVIAKPDYISGNPVMSDAWDRAVSVSENFTEADVPLLASLCYWEAVLLQSMGQVVKPDGRVVTLYGRQDELGNVDPQSVKANPDIHTAEKATKMILKLSDALNISPTARDRQGLVRAMTKSTQADVLNKTVKGYEDFMRLQKAANR